MGYYAELKHFVRMEVIRPVRRLRTLVTWKRWSFRGAPVIFGNSMPKSGSHLLMQIMKGICKLGPLVETGARPIRTITIDGRYRPSQEILSDLKKLRPGDVASGYLRATPENMQFIDQPGWVNYFIIRDPRDMLVSHVYYATDIYLGHGMHDYYKSIPMDERIKVAIRGIKEPELSLPSVRTRYDRIMGWFNCPGVMTVHFEDLILQREKTLNKMLDHLERGGFRPLGDRAAAIDMIMTTIDPQRSSTFRRGHVGDWREHFTEEHKRLFKVVAGDLMVCLGYEKNNDW